MSETAPNGTLEPCTCCFEEIGTTPDDDLCGVVCEGCRKLLRNAVAWLNNAGLRGCLKGAA